MFKIYTNRKNENLQCLKHKKHIDFDQKNSAMFENV